MRPAYFVTLIILTVPLATSVSRAKDSVDLSTTRPAVMLDCTDRFITVNRDDSVALYKTIDGSLLREFPTNGRYVERLAVSLDERFLLAACQGGTVTVWSLESGATICTTTTPFAYDPVVRDVCFSGDGNSFIVVFQDGHVLIYKTGSGRPIRDMRLPHRVEAASGALSQAGTWGVVIGRDKIFENEYRLFDFDADLGELRRTINWGQPPVRYSSTSLIVALPDNRIGTLRLLDTSNSAAEGNGWQTRDLGSFGRILSLRPTLEGEFLITSSKTDRTITGSIVDPRLRNVRLLFNLDGPLEGIAVSASQMKGVITRPCLQTEVYDLAIGTLAYTIDNSIGVGASHTDRNGSGAGRQIRPRGPDAPAIVLLALIVGGLSFLVIWRIIWERNTSRELSLDR